MKRNILTVMFFAFLANVSAPAAYGQVTVKNARENVPGLVFINRLRPVTFNWDLGPVDSLWWNRESPFDDEIPQELIDIQIQAKEAKEALIQTGFIAQEVDTAAQDIGYYFSGVDAAADGSAIYGLRYAEFVVPLTKAVQELSAQNEWLLAQIYELTGAVYDLQLKSGNADASGTGLQALTSNGASLQQNSPNPFSQSTQIKCYLPQSVKTATLNIYNLQGKQLKQIAVTQRGESSHLIAGSEFEPGIYLYALIADGRETDVKRMILTE